MATDKDGFAYRAFAISAAGLMVSLSVAVIRSNWTSVEEVRAMASERAALQAEQNNVWRERLDGMDKRLQDLQTRTKVLELQESQRGIRESAQWKKPP